MLHLLQSRTVAYYLSVVNFSIIVAVFLKYYVNFHLYLHESFCKVIILQTFGSINLHERLIYIF